jgi:hypothetical protein
MWGKYLFIRDKENICKACKIRRLVHGETVMKDQPPEACASASVLLWALRLWWALGPEYDILYQISNWIKSI